MTCTNCKGVGYFATRGGMFKSPCARCWGTKEEPNTFPVKKCETCDDTRTVEMRQGNGVTEDSIPVGYAPCPDCSENLFTEPDRNPPEEENTHAVRKRIVVALHENDVHVTVSLVQDLLKAVNPCEKCKGLGEVIEVPSSKYTGARGRIPCPACHGDTQGGDLTSKELEDQERWENQQPTQGGKSDG